MTPITKDALVDAGWVENPNWKGQWWKGDLCYMWDLGHLSYHPDMKEPTVEELSRFDKLLQGIK